MAVLCILNKNDTLGRARRSACCRRQQSASQAEKSKIISPNNEYVGAWSLWVRNGWDPDLDLLRACCAALEREGLLRPRWLVLEYPDREEGMSWGEADLAGVENVRVEGDGFTYDASGQRMSSPFVMQVSLDLSLGLLSMHSWSDAWLPVDLAGQPQPEIYARNAPRLRAALTEAERQTGWLLLRAACSSRTM